LAAAARGALLGRGDDTQKGPTPGARPRRCQIPRRVQNFQAIKKQRKKLKFKI